jgi:FtsP/CotA-like multicopper oxidase with cupredoxin domain
MRATKSKTMIARFAPVAATALASLLAAAAQAAVPGITGTSFALRAAAAYISQPDGTSTYSWGYGCSGSASFLPLVGMSNQNCPGMQIPGPTLIVNEGQTVTVTLTNNLPAAAGNTSILFPGFQVCAGALSGSVCTPSGGVPGLLTQEAAPGGTVTYSFDTTGKAGTHSYYSGTQGDLQIDMGLYGAIVVLPSAVPAICTADVPPGKGTLNDQAKAAKGESDFRLAKAAYNHPATCYDREYLFQFSEMDPKIHRAVEEIATCVAGQGIVCPNNMNSVETENYHPAYFLINGRSMPDDMDPNYAVQYQHQPYNGNPHMHPGELVLLRIIGHGRMQHPFHEHGNHVRVLARDGNLLLARDPANPGQPDPQQRLAGPLLFTTTTTPGQAMDGIFQWTGKGLNWDVFGHGYAGDKSVCVPDANGYYTSDPTAPNYYEWCGDHNKALESKPFGQVGSGGAVTLPDPNILTNGPWYGGSPYFGPDAMTRAVGTTPIPPSGTVANSPADEAGFAFMWHSHNEREITTNNIFPGGMLMMMLVDPRAFQIDESK